jgi:large subunit ribosomal protein L18
MKKKLARQRRALKTRAKIAELKITRLTVSRSNAHISAQVFSSCGTKVLASASSMEAAVRSKLASGANVEAAKFIGNLISERAKAVGIDQVAFDRSGFHYHGRVKALAEAARDGGLKF